MKSLRNTFIVFAILVVLYCGALFYFKDFEVEVPNELNLSYIEEKIEFLCPLDLYFEIESQDSNELNINEFFKTPELKRIKFIIETYNKNLTNEEKILIADAIIFGSRKHNLDSTLVTALIARETNFRKDAVSSVNAIGLMQVSFFSYPKHQEQLKKRNITFDDYKVSERYQVDIGCEILADILRIKKGNLVDGLTMYVGGKHNGYIDDIFKIMIASYDHLIA